MIQALFNGEKPMKNIKLTIEYEGTHYHGWQSQINAVTVQDVIQNALQKLTGEDCDLIGSSRTDMGVHALGMTANFHTSSSIPSEKVSYALNNLLPEDIVIRSSEEVPADFHSRYSAKGKRYRYMIYNASFRSAILRNRVYHVRYPLNLENMRKASLSFVGEHDFCAFMATGSNVKSTLRTIHHVSLEKEEDTIRFEIEGNGFLYNMVRIIVGTLVEVGMGKIRPDEVSAIIESGERKKAGITAPAHGLYLVRVYY